MKSVSVPLVGVLFCLTGICVAVSLLSYSVADPPELRGFPQSETLHNILGLPGAVLAAALMIPFGYAAYLTVVPLGVYGIRFLRCTDSPDKTFSHPVIQCVGFLFAAVGFAGLFAFVPDWLLKSPCPLIGPGGYGGTILTILLSSNIATTGIVIFLTSMILAGFVLVGDKMFLRILVPSQKPKTAQAPSAKKPKLPARDRTQKITLAEGEEEEEEYDGEYDEDEEYEYEEYEYELPSSELLEPSEKFDEELYNDAAAERAKLLEKILLNFKIKATVVDIQKGPVITQYELRLEPGTRINKVQQLQDDLGMELKTGSVRIVAPIPGKNTVGVELPNERGQTVRLRDVMEHSPEAVKDFALPLFLGKGVTGDPLVADLAKMPHLLIAGQTGTGKSVCLNSIIVSMLMTRSPEEVRMLMIDPKQVEFSPYQRIPHLLYPVVNDMQKAAGALSWTVDQMEERYDLFKRGGVRNLAEYNKLSADDLRRRMNMIDADDEDWEAIPLQLPYLVVVMDEVADLIQSVKEVEAYIIRLAQKGRAAGIHLILATQKPTREVFTSLIKTNLPARIAFRVSSKMDSMVILDRTGAEQLLGRGDMLFSQNNEIIRGQGALVTDEEIEVINEHIGTDEPDFDETLLELDAVEEEEAEEEIYDGKGKIVRDEMYYKAVDLVIQKGRGSVSMLQTCLGIGYPRASRMMDFMEEDGVVGRANGSKPREVLVSLHEWRRKRGVSRLSAASVSRRVESYDEEVEAEAEFVAT
jgi:DNA segregation ATPase FtsK/SpoIIIE-like protein